ncbi:MAG TPA: hypothetical protein VIK86_01280 [Candidatus Paceibacterota bacterium]
MKQNIINWSLVYTKLGYNPTTYNSKKRPKSKQKQIIELLNFIENWVEENKNK